MPPVTSADHALGPERGLTLVHYGDVECPLSQDVFGIVSEIRTAFPDRVRYVFRHLPLREHDRALGAAIALDAAGRQGAFWPLHDRLFAHPLRLAPADLVAHAEALGLDGAAIETALADPGRASAVLAQKKAGVAAGVRSTLNLFIDGVLAEDDALDEALAERVIRPLRARS